MGGGIYKAKGFIGRGWGDIVFFIIRIVFTFCSVHTGKRKDIGIMKRAMYYVKNTKSRKTR